MQRRLGDLSLFLLALAAVLAGCSSNMGGVDSGPQDTGGQDAVGSDSSGRDGGSGTTLPLNCAAPANATANACSESAARGSVGSGPSLAAAAGSDGMANIGGCAVDAANNRVLVTVHGTPNFTSFYDAVIAVDLANGNRTLLSGHWLNASGTAIDGGSGTPFPMNSGMMGGGFIGSIAPAAGGSWYVLAYTQLTAQVFEVTSAGARSIVWNGLTQSCPGPTDPMFNFTLAPAITSSADGNTLYVTGLDSFAVWQITNGQCTIASLNDTVDTSRNRGTGATAPAEVDTSVLAMNGTFYAANLNSGALYTVNLTNGNWALFSDYRSMVGGGAAVNVTGPLAYFNNVLWSTSDSAHGGLIGVNPANGTRTLYPDLAHGGPSMLGPMNGGPAPISGACLAGVPGHTYLVASVPMSTGDGLALYEPSTGLSVLLSY